MKFIPQSIPDILLIEPIVLRDKRGYFVETFRQDMLDQALGYKINFIQDNESESISKGVLRGLHYQSPPYIQSKLVRVIKGRILDVAVDIRQDSPTFGKHVSVELSGENKKQIFVPKGFAHGFAVLSEGAIIAYKVDTYFSAHHNEGIAYNDKDIAVDWLLPEADIILSEADRINLHLTEKKNLL
jgi:dTDP-4-dehydrorhamnose 3,5-epimerase